MEKFKEKLNLLREEADQASARASQAEENVKKLTILVQQKDNEILSLQNKIVLLNNDLDKTEKRAKDFQTKKSETDAQASLNVTFQKKLSNLEADVEASQQQVKEANEKIRKYEVKIDQLERQAERFEKERSGFETRLDGMTNKYQAVKKELDDTLRTIADL